MSKGVPALAEGGWGEDGGYRYGTMLVFAGMIITGILDLLVHFVSKNAGVNESIDATKVPEVNGKSSESNDTHIPSHKPSDAAVGNMEAGKMSPGGQSNSASGTLDHLDPVRSSCSCRVQSCIWLPTFLLFSSSYE